MGNRESTVSVRRMLSGAPAVEWRTGGVVGARDWTITSALQSLLKSCLTHTGLCVWSSLQSSLKSMDENPFKNNELDHFSSPVGTRVLSRRYKGSSPVGTRGPLP